MTASTALRPSSRLADDVNPEPGPGPSPSPLSRLADLAAIEARISHLEHSTLSPASAAQAPVATPQPSVVAAAVHASTATSVPLSRSTPAAALLGTFAAPLLTRTDHSASAVAAELEVDEPALDLDRETHEALLRTYEAKVQWRYPFLRLHHLRTGSHTSSSRSSSRRRPREPGAAFFTAMVYSISLLVDKTLANLGGTAAGLHDEYYRLAVTRHLAAVFEQPDRLLHVQAYLVLAMHAVYSPSTERIITLASAAMRACVMAQLHCAAAEPEPSDVAARVHIQMRRRVFWCAYKLDRTVGATFHLPCAVSDSHITVRLYANVDDPDLEQHCSRATTVGSAAGSGGEVRGVDRLTDVSAALHVVYCRQIQSEILNFTLHRNHAAHHRHDDRWRLRVLDKLDRWRVLWQRYEQPGSGTNTSGTGNWDWIDMMYSYSLGMLYRPTKTSVFDSAGAWTVKASVQALLIFRRFQRDTANTTELWLGLVTQFKCGVALLYTFFATPPALRPPVFEHPDVPEAVRACSITLTLIGERWPQSRCLRDTFDLLAREVPLTEHAFARHYSTSSSAAAGPMSAASTASRSQHPLPAAVPARPRVRDEARRALLELLVDLEHIVVHRDTLRMIREMATEEFPVYALDATAGSAHPVIPGDIGPMAADRDGLGGGGGGMATASRAAADGPGAHGATVGAGGSGAGDRRTEAQQARSQEQEHELPEHFFQPATPSGLYFDGLGLADESLAETAIEYPTYLDTFDFSDPFRL
ncbi:uncharacterized protein B0I36DRAFT_369106 [Microdochium trichocladiopsis]|uniref:Xylanolytic transcriptional activator regulatory domain-containing protein n=1 Tax=Microdochium trichocladiopsis TaxID=1682393 RepID=A0A9P8XUM4_9PEZI|nr:uncharacterized protein B0I36DRAFT_369106 [Microdochium trichocladiopsis]KAH7014112.1 hypothetical protein B0I36DRAFT_369106 [Microdochium trichocladiopsis]